MDKKSKQTIEIFFTIIFSGITIYALSIISNPEVISNNITWLCFSVILLGVTSFSIYYIFDLKYNDEDREEIVMKFLFILFMSLSFFAFIRIMLFESIQNSANLIQQLYTIIIILMILNGTIFLLDKNASKHKKAQCKIVGFVCYGVALYIITQYFNLSGGGL